MVLIFGMYMECVKLNDNFFFSVVEEALEIAEKEGTKVQEVDNMWVQVYKTQYITDLCSICLGGGGGTTMKK